MYSFNDQSLNTRNPFYFCFLCAVNPGCVEFELSNVRKYGGGTIGKRSNDLLTLQEIGSVSGDILGIKAQSSEQRRVDETTKVFRGSPKIAKVCFCLEKFSVIISIQVTDSALTRT